MGINSIGIGAIIGAIMMAGIQLYMFAYNRKKDELKERIERLYSPLYVYYLENMKYGESKGNYDFYKYYVALKEIYVANSIYASDILKELFQNLMSIESDLMELTLEDRVHKMCNQKLFIDDKGQKLDLQNMMSRVDGWIDREHDELQLYYAKGLISRFLWRLIINQNPGYARGSIPAGRSFD